MDTALTRTVLVVAVVVAAAAEAQRRPQPRPSPLPSRGPQVGSQQPGSPCEFAQQQPSITLTLQPEVVYPGDRVTLTWRVVPRRPPGEWSAQVALRASFAIDPRLPADPGNAGSHTFTAPDADRDGTITLSTRCGEEQVRLRVQSGAELRSVVPDRGAPGATVHVNGSGLGARQGTSRVVLAVGRREIDMPVVRWRDGNAEVRVPEGAPRGEGTIRVLLGGRLPTAAADFRVLGVTVIGNPEVQLVVGALDLDQVALRLHDGVNASTFTSSPGLRAAGVDDATFTVPAMTRAVGDSYTTMASIVLAAGFYAKRVRYGVDDMRSSSVTTALEGGRLVLRVAFESNGRELKGELEGCSALTGACEWTDSAAPDGDLNQARVTVRATLAARNGAVVVDALDGEFEAAVSLGDIAAVEDVARAVSEYSRTRVRTEVERALNQTLTSPALRRAISDQLAAVLAGLGVGRVTALRAEGGTVRVEYE